MVGTLVGSPTSSLSRTGNPPPALAFQPVCHTVMVLEVIPVWNVYLSSSHGCRALNIWSWPQLRTQKIPWTFILFFNLGILICGQVLIHVSWKNQRTAEHESRLTTTAPTWHPAAQLIKECTLKNVSKSMPLNWSRLLCNTLAAGTISEALIF